MCSFTPVYLKILISFLYPFIVLFYGIGNIKETNKEYSDMWNEKERGKFLGDTIYKRGASGALYEGLIVSLKFKEGR